MIDYPTKALEQYKFIIRLVEDHTRPTQRQLILTPQLIQKLHRIVFNKADPNEGGQYRTASVIVAGSDHQPTKPSEIAHEVGILCQYVNDRWAIERAEHLAAYVLWKLNWIHPFRDGNGRTARALSYLVLSVRIGAVLPGSPTIPEQLLYQRERYFDALQAADLAFAEKHQVDVSELEAMLRDMLVHQLTGSPAIPHAVYERLYEIFDKRILRAPRTATVKLFRNSEPAARLWQVGDHFVFQVGPTPSIARAQQTQESFGTPFPRLLAAPGARAPIKILEAQRGIVLHGCEYDASSGYALEFEHNAAAVVEHPRVHWDAGFDGVAGSWENEGVLYVVRLGRKITTDRADDVFDLIIARHIIALGA